MSFLSVAFLAALPLAAAPILLHLFDRRRNVVIEWGAMQFLMEAASRKTSARRLMQWLLLALRVLAVACLVLALARPMAQGDWFGNRERSETIFVLDNSMSMLRAVENQSLFDAAVHKSTDMLDDMQPGDFVRVLLASPYPTWVTPGAMRFDTDMRPILAEQLQDLRPTHGGSDLLAALLTAVQAEAEPTAKRRRIVLLTDGQRSDWSFGDEAGWQRFRESRESASVPAQLEVVNLGGSAGAIGNLAVNRIHASRTVVGVQQPFTVTAEVQNHSDTPSPACSAKWSVGDDGQSTQIPALDGGAIHEVAWKHSFATTGVNALTCQVDAEDCLTADNRDTIIVEVVDQVPVLLVESAPEQVEFQRDAFFVQAALGWVDGERGDSHEVYVPTLAAPDQLEHIALQKYRAVVIPNLTELREDAIRRLESFVSDGGGLWIALGPRTDIEHFNHHLFADGNGLAPQAVDRIVDQPMSGAQKTLINPFGKAHPATAALSDNQRLDTGDIAVSRSFRFALLGPGEDASVLLSLTNGEPFAIEKTVGHGRVIVQSIPLRLQWSDLAKSQAFVVMVQDWLSYLTQPQATRHNLTPGAPISLHVAGTDAREATLTTPQGDEIELTADSAGDGVVFRSSRTILPGDYRLEVGLSGQPIPFHVQRDSQESDLTPLTAADQKLQAGIFGSERLADGELSAGAKLADPLWPLLWMVLLALIAAELSLSGIISRQRFETEPIAETAEHAAQDTIGIPSTAATKPHSTGARHTALTSSRT